MSILSIALKPLVKKYSLIIGEPVTEALLIFEKGKNYVTLQLNKKHYVNDPLPASQIALIRNFAESVEGFNTAIFVCRPEYSENKAIKQINVFVNVFDDVKNLLIKKQL